MNLFYVLLIEKEAAIRENWKELLTLMKYKVNAIGSLEGVKDVNHLLTRYFTGIDAVIADTDSVGLDGLMLKQVLNNDFSRTPLIMTSADNVPPWSLDREELSAVAFLRKPFDNSLLLEYLSKAQKIKSLLSVNGDSNRAIAKLLINQPNTLPTEIALKRSYTIGRCRDTDPVQPDIRLNSASASRKHAFLIRIYRGRDSYYKLIDFSSNGIFVNGRRIPTMVRLNHQDEIELYPGAKAIYTEIEREKIDLDVTLTGKE